MNQKPLTMNRTNDILSRISIRDYRPEDYPTIESLWLATGLGGFWRGDDRAVIEKSLAIGGKLLVALDVDGALVGTSWMTFDGRRLHLHHVGVLPDYRRSGIGRLLSIESIRFAREKQVQIKLEVHRSNEAAVSMYKKLGFQYLGDYDVYIIRDYQAIGGFDEQQTMI